MWSQERYLKALHFASIWHNEQKIPGTELPYVIHPVAVAMEVIAAFQFEAGITDLDFCIECALLHDIIEDTKADYGAVLKDFGKKTADGVLALTKNSKYSDKSEAMRDSLARIKDQPFEISLVKIADRISNLRKPPFYWTREKTKNYSNEALIILNELGKEGSYLSKRLEQKIEDYRVYWEDCQV